MNWIDEWGRRGVHGSPAGVVSEDDSATEAKEQAARDLTAVAAERRLNLPIARTYPVTRIAEAHQPIEADAQGGRVLPCRDLNARPLRYQGSALPRTPRWAHFEFRRTAFLRTLVP